MEPVVSGDGCSADVFSAPVWAAQPGKMREVSKIADTASRRI
jgi:hypothetical protein